MSNILIISGSLRKGNYTQYVSQFLFELLEKKQELEPSIIFPKDLNLTWDNEGYEVNLAKLDKATAKADCYILVSPEYNHSFSASLKYILDTSPKGFKKKPVAIVGVSSGPFGGTRMIESLTPVLRYFSMYVSGVELNVSNVQEEIVDEKFKDPKKWEKRAEKMINELLSMVDR